MILATIGLVSCKKDDTKIQACTTCTGTYEPSMGLGTYVANPYCASKADCLTYISNLTKDNKQGAVLTWSCTDPE